MGAQHRIAERLKQQFQDTLVDVLGSEETMQETLYHYTSVDSLMGMVESNRLWMSKGTFLNDSSELVYIMDVVQSVSRTIWEQQSDNKVWQLCCREFDKAADRFSHKINESDFEVYFFSLAYAKDSLALWYNYANGDGYNIGFSAKELLTNIGAPTEQLRVQSGFVEYDREKQEETLLHLVRKASRLAEETSLETAEYLLPDHFFEVIATCAIFFKEPAFRSEEEYRLACFRSEEGEGQTRVQFRARNGVIIPYIEVSLQEKLPISHVTIGPKNNIDIAKSGIEDYLKSKGYDLDRIVVGKSVAALRY